jgi:antirestriction protein ArdC
MAHQNEIRVEVNDKIIAALSKGLTPWKKPWVASKNAGNPANAVSGRSYRGINPLLLELAAMDKGFKSKWWGTYRQWQTLGGQVKGGERGTRIVFWSPVTNTRTNAAGEEKSKTFPLMREYTVFCADQCEGAERFAVEPAPSTTVVDFDPAEKVIAGTGADIRHIAGDKAAYNRAPHDFIVLPMKSQFDQAPFGLPGYYATAFHELMHWTEHRLNWNGTYALGELRAEIGAAYLASEIGIPIADNLENHAKYLDSWLKTMQADAKVIFQITSAASKGADFILAFSREPQPQPQEGELVTA